MSWASCASGRAKPLKPKSNGAMSCGKCPSGSCARVTIASKRSPTGKCNMRSLASSKSFGSWAVPDRPCSGIVRCSCRCRRSFLASGLIYLNSHAVDFQTPELRPYLDRYLRGSDGAAASARVKLMKLLWDAVGTEFGGRHELCERNYAGNSELIRVQTLQSARERGQLDHFKSFAEQCMAEYGLDGWTVP